MEEKTLEEIWDAKSLPAAFATFVLRPLRLPGILIFSLNSFFSPFLTLTSSLPLFSAARLSLFSFPTPSLVADAPSSSHCPSLVAGAPSSSHCWRCMCLDRCNLLVELSSLMDQGLDPEDSQSGWAEISTLGVRGSPAAAGARLPRRA